MKLAKVSLADLGRAKRVVIDRENTTIIGSAGSKQAVDGRCAVSLASVLLTEATLTELPEPKAKMAPGLEGGLE
jgi:chaperonin GroEL